MHMASLSKLGPCILDNGFVVKVELVTAAWLILGSVLSVFDTIDELPGIVWIMNRAKRELRYFQRSMLNSAAKNKIKPVVEKNGSKKSGW